MPDPKDIFKSILEKGAHAVAPDVSVEIHIERPKNPDHGDLSSNIAMQVARQLKRNPREVAQEFIEATATAVRESGFAKRFEIAGPGFLNVRLDPAFKLQSVRKALEQGAEYGRVKSAAPQKIQVEFVSANPTGPL